MGRPAIVSPDVEAVIAGCGLTRNALVRLYTTSHDELNSEGDCLRQGRHPESPDRFFAYRIKLTSGDHWHQLDFVVDDATADTRFFVEDVTHTSWPW
jgi:hypothetical protein